MTSFDFMGTADKRDVRQQLRLVIQRVEARRVNILAAGLAATVASAMLGSAPAQAQFAPAGCYLTTPCAFTLAVDPDQPYYPFTRFETDYTVQTDGRTHIYTIRYTSADPTALLYLDDPNQLDSFVSIRGPNGTIEEVYDRPIPSSVFRTFSAPGLFRVTFAGPRAFDYCSTRSGPVGQVCAANWNIWGNATGLVLRSTADLNGVFTSNVPEPATWALLLGGFAVVGVTARRRSRTVVAA
ncbi:PEPxxWA-CTERM sorting domain-containing protein [Glacieibacterium sp.]|uniref:PEPxxWA-CTERM sorting domain-containing protein n=1 Tax=Glacieibacterium sp. TaxID=2860237 RepID=UPI003B00EE24